MDSRDHPRAAGQAGIIWQRPPGVDCDLQNYLRVPDFGAAPVLATGCCNPIHVQYTSRDVSALVWLDIRNVVNCMLRQRLWRPTGS